jgi:hypothetical protein
MARLGCVGCIQPPWSGGAFCARIIGDDQHRAYFNITGPEGRSASSGCEKTGRPPVDARGRVHRQRHGNCALRVPPQGLDARAGDLSNDGHAKALLPAISLTAIMLKPAVVDIEKNNGVEVRQPIALPS